MRMGGDEAREHPHGGAGVTAIERAGRLTEVAGDSGDLDGAVVALDDGRAPRDCMQAREECGSAPVEKLVRRVVPSARPASMA